MKREWANAVRFAMDECIPPVIRDSRWFMRPFFMAAYGTRDVDRFMDFKEHVWGMTDEEYADFYRNLGHSVSRRRETDLSARSVRWILESVPEGPVSVLDVGCGNGYLMRALAEARPDARITGVDVSKERAGSDLDVVEGLLPSVPLATDSYDTVICTHVLEHVPALDDACRELVRIARQEILIVVPRQRAYHYTLDEHVNFFWKAEDLARHFLPARVSAALIDGDWGLRVAVYESGLGAAQPTSG